MKTESMANRSWDDLVFENRHKEYGAYSIRQAYSRNMTIGSTATVALALAIIFVPRLFPDAPLPIVDTQPIISTIVKVIDVPRIIQPKPEQPVVQAKAPKGPSHQAPRVTTAEVNTVTPTVQQIADAPANSIPDGVEGAVAPVSNGNAVAGTPASVVDPSVPFDIVEQMPAYEGGVDGMMKYLSKHTRYPAAARRVGTEGTVFVSFVVDALGKVVDVKVVRGISAECDKEASRVIASMPGWSAGVQNGIHVPVRMVVPIRFRLNTN